jgi:hypothetical protein
LPIRLWRVTGCPLPTGRSILGRWRSEGFEYVFSWREGALRASRADDAPGKPPAVFAAIEGEPDQFRTVSGREVGKRLRLWRDPDSGTVTRMNWATYRVIRTQETVDGINVSDPDPSRNAESGAAGEEMGGRAG